MERDGGRGERKNNSELWIENSAKHSHLFSINSSPVQQEIITTFTLYR